MLQIILYVLSCIRYVSPGSGSLFVYLCVYCFVAALSRTKNFYRETQANDKVKNKVKWTEFNFFVLLFFVCIVSLYWDRYKIHTNLRFISFKLVQNITPIMWMMLKLHFHKGAKSSCFCVKEKKKVFFYNFFLLTCFEPHTQTPTDRHWHVNTWKL